MNGAVLQPHLGEVHIYSALYGGRTGRREDMMLSFNMHSTVHSTNNNKFVQPDLFPTRDVG